MIKKLILGIFLLIGVFIAALLFWPEKSYQPYEASENWQAQVDKFQLPPMPADWTWHKFETEDGTKLRWGETGNRGASDVTLIIVPGYTATVSMYGEHADDLAERGYHVIGVDLRGQGGSDRHDPKQPERLWVEDFSIYSDDLAAFIKSQNLTERTVIPVASSFGGHVGTRMARDYPDLVDGLFLIAPAIEPKAGDVPFEKAGKQMKTAQKLGQGKKYLPGNGDWKPVTPDDIYTHGIDYCSSNPLRLPYRDVIFTREPEQRVGGVTVQWGAEFFESAELMREPGYFDSITIPVAIVAADQDDFVVNDVIDKTCDVLSDCTLRRFPGSGHCLMQETDDVIKGIWDEVDALAARINPR